MSLFHRLKSMSPEHWTGEHYDRPKLQIMIKDRVQRYSTTIEGVVYHVQRAEFEVDLRGDKQGQTVYSIWEKHHQNALRQLSGMEEDAKTLFEYLSDKVKSKHTGEHH